MPGKTVRSVGQSRMAKHRIVTQEEIVSALFESPMEDITFGIVQRHNGNGQISVLLPDKKEGRAVLRGLLGRCNIKNAFPTGSIVVLGIREFEKNSLTLDIMAPLARKDAKNLMKINRIPEWMISMADGSSAKPGTESFEFDYENVDAEEGVTTKAKTEKEREKAKEIDRSKKGAGEDAEFDIDDI